MMLPNSRRRATIGALALTLTAGLGLSTAGAAGVAAAAPARMAPLYSGGTEVPGEYIVVLKGRDEGGPRTSAATALAGPVATARDAGGTVHQQYTAALRGFHAKLPDAAVDTLRRDPAVAFVQTNSIHKQARETGQASQAPGGQAKAIKDPGTQPNPPSWGLDRIDQRKLPLDNTFKYPDDGAGVNVYVLDSGIRKTHVEFEGRAVGVYDAIKDGNGTNDCLWHGTFVSSVVAGKSYGVAKKANIKAVRLIDCNNYSTTAQAVDGMNWTAKNAVKPAIVNMSWQSDNGIAIPAVDTAAKGIIDAGLIAVFIAGNFGKGDCQNSPKDPQAITMGNSNKNDQRHTGQWPSSYGSCLTAFAPGTEVNGARHDSDTATGWGTGTSFAAPTAAGVVAIALENNPNLTMARAKDLIINTSTKDVLTNVGSGSPNRLLYVGDSGTPHGPSTVLENTGYINSWNLTF
ncbi:S8 family peptidase [Streptomyces sp. KR80]|uniref:S8 family peptidase n=1 Tax=Streptomyces sp. KR80 TaxID=3457426 RepID=UPI003FD05794